MRRNLGGKLYLVTYGRAAAVHLDPVEKKPLYHFHPGEGILSVGTVRCNLFCAFCQNWEPPLPPVGPPPNPHSPPPLRGGGPQGGGRGARAGTGAGGPGGGLQRPLPLPPRPHSPGPGPKTLEKALALDAEGLARAEACGALPWATLTHLARSSGWRPRLLAYATSAEAGGEREQVVGYGALAYERDDPGAAAL